MGPRPVTGSVDASSGMDRLSQFRREWDRQLARFDTRPALEKTEPQSSLGDFEGVLKARWAVVEQLVDVDERYAQLREIGELCAEQPDRADDAVVAYEQAILLRPDDREILHRLLDLHGPAGRWSKVLGLLDRLVAVESEPSRRARYHHTAAVIFRDQQEAPQRALERFEAALDDDPTLHPAFYAAKALAVEHHEWHALERAYRRVLAPLTAGGPVALQRSLWSELAELYRTHLGDARSRAVALSAVTRLEPGNIERHVELAELYERLQLDDPTEFVDAAVREHQILIANEPFRYASYHALFNIYVKAKRVDAALCLAAGLSFLQEASPEEEAYFERHRPGDFAMARQRLSEDTLRRYVLHPDQDPHLTSIMGLIAPAVAAWRALPLPGSLNAKERIDVSVDPSLFSRMTKYVRDVLDVSQPDVFLRPSDKGDLVLMNVERDDQLHPTIVVFQNLLRRKAEPHLAFALGRAMMDLYLPHLCFVALDRSPQALKQVLMACMLGVGLPVHEDVAALELISREIFGRMQPGARDQVRSMLHEYIEAGGSTDLKRWAAASELTAYRVGLLLSGDLRIAAQMISEEQASLGSTMSPRDKIKELVLYSISEDYFAARRALGLDAGG